MSVEAMAIALHHSRAKGAARTILVGIANHDGDGGAFPSMRSLAKYGAVDVRNARKHVARLVELKEIRVHLQGGNIIDKVTGKPLPAELQPNRYDFLLVCPPWCDRTKQHRDTRKRRTIADSPDLWMNPRADSSGGTEAPGGPPDESAPLTVHYQPPTTGSPSTTDRASDPPCSVCGKSRLDCERRAAISEHTYSPSRRTA